MKMNVGLLKELIADLPNDMPVFTANEEYCNYDFAHDKPFDGTDTFAIVYKGKLFITDESKIPDENWRKKYCKG